MGPSEASVKFFDETFFQKSFDLALDLSGRQPERSYGNRGFAPLFPDGGAVALSVTAAAVPALPKGEPSLASPFGGGAPVGGGEGSGKPPSWCVTVREKRFAVSLAFSHALRAYKGKVVGLCPTTRKLFEKSLTKNF